MTKTIAINGMGRIGRAALRILLDSDDFELTAVNDLRSAHELVDLLAHDSDFESLQGKMRAGEDYIEFDNRSIRKYCELNPEKLPWKQNNIDLVFECSGMLTERRDLEKHIRAGAGHVILCAPGKENDIQTVVYGANSLETPDNILSCGSGSTNCISPVMEIIDRRLGILKAIMTTSQPYRSPQSIAAKVIQEESAMEQYTPVSMEQELAITPILPELGGLYDGVMFSGSTPKGYMADIVLCTLQKTSVEEINTILKEEAGSERYRNVLGVSTTPVESEDIIMDQRASIVDLSMTRVVGGDLVKIVSWYNNEWGYSHQMVRTAKQLLNMQL